MNKRTHHLAALFSAISVLLPIVAIADIVTWTGGNGGFGYQWLATCWDTGTLPETGDTVRFVDIPAFQNRIENGTTQSIGLQDDVTIAGFHYENQYGCVVNGQKNLAISFVTADSKSSPVTNSIGTAAVVLNATQTTFNLGTNQYYIITANNLNEATAATALVKEGAGTLVLAGAFVNYTGDTIVREGTLYRSGNGHPALRGNLIVGGGDAPAELLFGTAAQPTMTNPQMDIDVRPNGTIRYAPRETAPTTSYHEWLSIDHGMMALEGKGFIQYDRTETPDRTPEFIFDGGIVTNGEIWIASTGELVVRAADIPSRIYGKFGFQKGYEMNIPDGTAPVDFLVDGDFNGANRGVHKAGAGTMLIRCDQAISTWGGVAGRPFNVYSGALFIESGDDGIGMGTNNVIVSAGAAYGGVGRHVGAPVNLRGLWGNVTLNGTESARATFIPGRIDIDTGAIAPGTYYLGNAEQTNNVISSGYAELRCRVDATGASCLAVNGRLLLSATDRLAVVGPANIPAGTYTLATFTNGFANRFADVTVNGADIAASKGKVAYLDANGAPIASASYDGAGSIVFVVPETETVILFR